MSGRSPARVRAPLTERKVNKPMRIAAWVFGLAFLAIGVMGFIPGLTAHADQMTMMGHHSPALLFGVFQVSLLHNMVHLGLGTAGVIAAVVSRPAAEFLLWGGIVYAALWLYGILVPAASSLNVVPVNGADNWLHLGLAVGMLGSRFLLVHRGPLPDAPLDFEENVWAHHGEGVPHSEVGRVAEVDRSSGDRAGRASGCDVCRNALNADSVTEFYNGREYHLCSQWCQEQFLRVPQRYTQR